MLALPRAAASSVPLLTDVERVVATVRGPSLLDAVKTVAMPAEVNGAPLLFHPFTFEPSEI